MSRVSRPKPSKAIEQHASEDTQQNKGVFVPKNKENETYDPAGLDYSPTRGFPSNNSYLCRILQFIITALIIPFGMSAINNQHCISWCLIIQIQVPETGFQTYQDDCGSV